jgi:hypothetical protein
LKIPSTQSTRSFGQCFFTSALQNSTSRVPPGSAGHFGDHSEAGGWVVVGGGVVVVVGFGALVVVVVDFGGFVVAGASVAVVVVAANVVVVSGATVDSDGCRRGGPSGAAPVVLVTDDSKMIVIPGSADVVGAGTIGPVDGEEPGAPGLGSAEAEPSGSTDAAMANVTSTNVLSEATSHAKAILSFMG